MFGGASTSVVGCPAWHFISFPRPTPGQARMPQSMDIHSLEAVLKTFYPRHYTQLNLMNNPFQSEWPSGWTFARARLVLYDWTGKQYMKRCSSRSRQTRPSRPCYLSLTHSGEKRTSLPAQKSSHEKTRCRQRSCYRQRARFIA